MIRLDMKRKASKISALSSSKLYDFQQYETTRSFGEKIYHCKAIIVEAEEEQSNLLENLVKFNNKSRLKKRR